MPHLDGSEAAHYVPKRRTIGGDWLGGRMPQWRDFLDRFRPAGTPGAAAQGGVPADRTADMATELEPVFMLLDDVHAAAARIIRRAAEQADKIRQDAGRQAAEIVARAQAQAGTARAEAAVQSRALTAAENTRMEAERDRELEELRARAETRMPDYNDRVVAGARALLEEFCEPSGEPRDARR